MEKIIGIWKHAEKVKNKIVQKFKKIKYEQKNSMCLCTVRNDTHAPFAHTYFFLKGSRLSAKYWLSNGNFGHLSNSVSFFGPCHNIHPNDKFVLESH